MNEASNQILLEAAEKLREDLAAFMEKSAYTAPEMFTPEARQWVAITESLVDLFEAAVPSENEALREKAIVVAAAFTSTYTEIEDLSEVKTRVMKTISSDAPTEPLAEQDKP